MWGGGSTRIRGSRKIGESDILLVDYKWDHCIPGLARERGWSIPKPNCLNAATKIDTCSFDEIKIHSEFSLSATHINK